MRRTDSPQCTFSKRSTLLDRCFGVEAGGTGKKTTMSFIASSARASAFGLLARPLRAPTALAAPRAAVRAYSDKAAEQEAPKEDAEAPKEEGATDAEAQLKEKEERIKQLSVRL